MAVKRRPPSTKQRVLIFERAHGICCLCGIKIRAGERWEAHHVVARWVTGLDELDEFRPAHVKCHRERTSRTDVPEAAKAKRIKAKHIGAHRTKHVMQGSRLSQWKKRMDGTVERRR